MAILIGLLIPYLIIGLPHWITYSLLLDYFIGLLIPYYWITSSLVVGSLTLFILLCHLVDTSKKISKIHALCARKGKEADEHVQRCV